MSRPDLNLLFTLEALLVEGSVARAAKRLDLSPSAMSRSLARLRETTGDPLLVRAGRGMVPTPRAIELRKTIAQLVTDVRGALTPAEGLIDLSGLERTFTIRTSQGFVENFGPELIARVGAEAPRVRLRFVDKSDKDAESLRSGATDLETGVVGESTGPELRAQKLFRDRFVGVIRADHPLSKGKVTLKRYLAGKHRLVSRRGTNRGPVESALSEMGVEREIVTVVSGFSTAIALVRASELIATVPERQTGNLRSRMKTFSLPFLAPEITVSMLWHPRMDSDAAHKWLRNVVLQTCTAKV